MLLEKLLVKKKLNINELTEYEAFLFPIKLKGRYINKKSFKPIKN